MPFMRSTIVAVVLLATLLLTTIRERRKLTLERDRLRASYAFFEAAFRAECDRHLAQLDASHALRLAQVAAAIGGDVNLLDSLRRDCRELVDTINDNAAALRVANARIQELESELEIERQSLSGSSDSAEED